MTTSSRGRVAVLASGTGSILGAILAAQASGVCAGSVVAVISDRPDAPALDRARAAGIATAVVRLADFESRDAWNDAMVQTLRAFKPDLIVLAGFMKVLGPQVVSAFAPIINTHPSLLPAFPGAHAVRDALAHGVKVTGCTVHLVDEGLDTGPILAQRAVPIPHGASEEDVHEQIKVVERTLICEVISNLLCTWR